MKQFIFRSILIASLCISTVALFAGDFYFRLNGAGSNFWSSSYISYPTNVINTIIFNALNKNDGDDATALTSYDISIIRAYENGERMHFRRGNYFGFQAKDMFNHVRYGFTVGWQPSISIFGLYAGIDYGFDRFRLDIDPGNGNSSLTKYKLHSIQPEFGMRLLPLRRFVLEFGGKYTHYFKLKYGLSAQTSELNDGFTSHYAFGFRAPQIHASIVWGLEWDHYNIFNQDFEYSIPEKSIINYKPYENITTKSFTIFMRTAIEL